MKKIYLIYRIYNDAEMANEFGRDWEGNEPSTRLYGWTVNKKLRNIFRNTHKKKKFVYETRPYDDVVKAMHGEEQFIKNYGMYQLHVSKFRYDYRLSEDETIKVVTTDYEEDIIDSEWNDSEICLFQEKCSIPTLKIFKEKYQVVLDLIAFSYYWASANYMDDDVEMMTECMSYGIGPCGNPSFSLEPNQFNLYVHKFASILKEKRDE